MRRTERLHRLLDLLRARRLTTADGLASALGVSKRTVYRDIRELVASGVGIRGEAGVGYALARGTDPAPVTFTAEEATALALGARLLRSCPLDGLAERADAGLSKIEAGLLEPAGHSVFDPLQTAVAEQRTVVVTARGGVAHRLSAPALCVAERWSLVGWSEGEQRYVAVDLAEISAVDVLERTEPASGALDTVALVRGATPS